MSKLDKEKYIKIEELEAGEAYYGDGRNFSIAIWDGFKFNGLRHKFGDKFIDAELHYDTDVHHGTFKPKRKLI